MSQEKDRIINAQQKAMSRQQREIARMRQMLRNIVYTLDKTAKRSAPMREVLEELDNELRELGITTKTHEEER